MADKLPDIVEQMRREHPDVWDAYNALGEAASAAGPIDPNIQRLVKLAIAIGAQKEGAVHSHARRALKIGFTREELVQVALLAITTLGWSSAMAALTWVQDVTDR